MILVDTSVWVDHLRAGDKTLAGLLNEGGVLTHPFVIGELALGKLRGRAVLLADLQALPKAQVATDREVLDFVEREKLFGHGIGYVDVHLLASVRLTPDAALWTRDAKLAQVAKSLDPAMVAFL